jgi:hypothetical protein
MFQLQLLKTTQNPVCLTSEKFSVYPTSVSPNRSKELKQAVQRVFAFGLNLRITWIFKDF